MADGLIRLYPTAPAPTWSEAALRLAPWSVSKAKLVRTCPLAWKLKYVDGLPDATSDVITRVGVAVHAVLERTTRGDAIEPALTAVSGELALTSGELAGLRRFLPGIAAFGRTLAAFRSASAIRHELCEQRIGVTADLRPTNFRAPDAFFRGTWDLGFVLADGTVAVIDHKTGRKGDLRWHAAQLRAYAVLAQAVFPALERVWPGIHFVGEAEVLWDSPGPAEHIRTTLRTWFIDWINEAAVRAAAAAEDAAPVVSRFCDFCGHRPVCPAHNPTELVAERLVALRTRRSHG